MLAARRAALLSHRFNVVPFPRSLSLRPKIGWDGPISEADGENREKSLLHRAVFSLLPAAMVNTGMLSTVGMPALLGALGFWWYKIRLPARKYDTVVDLNQQTRALPDGSRIAAYLKSDALEDHAFPNVRTLYDVIRNGAVASNNGPMIGRRVRQEDGSEPYMWYTYNEVMASADDLAHAFRRLGIPVGDKTNIAIFCRNRPEWVITEHAAYNFSNVIVPLYDTLGPGASSYILNQTDTELVICDNMGKADQILEAKIECPQVKYVVVCDTADLNEARRSYFKSHHIDLYTFQELLDMGKLEKRIEHCRPEKKTLATICYTSGTTGNPKGVMLTHGNIVANTTCVKPLKGFFEGKNEVMFSFLPMAHMYDRMLQNTMFSLGSRVGFYNGQLTELISDLQALQPTMMPCVPRVLNRMYDRVMAQVNSSPIKKLLFKVAIDYKMRELQAGICRNDSIFDKLVFKKIQQLTGGRMRVIITGSAPISRNVLSFARCAFGCQIFEGYGQTECVAAATVGTIGDTRPGHVGIPIPCCAVKLVDAPELNYLVKEGKGEVCIRGYNVTPGYYKNEEETKKTIDEDGWLHTGDIGMFEEQGTLKIMDRKKHIFKLAQGEYIAPEKIENVYARSRYVAQAFVHGDSLQNSLVAIIVPDHETLGQAAEKHLKLQGLTIEELCQRSDVKKMIMGDMRATARESALHSFEQAKAIYLEPEMFSIENGLLTPTMKSKRPELAKKYAYEIDKMYEEMGKAMKL
ncbi:unnamed protein product [Bursaphelenchus xylophilus]|uniref:Long-chain-fatty-acid--CoA ligase n=1 Tax=Bursaphelenchus xylophilus TaxID=6326 RepID=A0A1I7RJH8_BURXY|nr:unnamed protein product [Bursaphelenchus xylophilus]CAG9128893.1 unnamed protein product [Bursaphelenchus xylophilus]